jgi:two-component system, OmpR family, sensor histidine kinase KdpD
MIMKTSSRLIISPPLQFILSLLILIITIGLLLMVRRQLSIQVIALLFLLPVVFCARFWGLGPGILTATVAFLSLNYFFIPPYYTLAVHQSQDLLALIVFLIIAVVISQLLGHDQESIASVRSREREATQLYELSLALSGILEENAVAQVLADKICETFIAEKVEIKIKGAVKVEFSACQPETLDPDSLPKPDIIQPLLTTRGQQGTINIWRNHKPLSKGEQRLLSTFISQGALAVERALLTKSENRTKVFEESDHLKSALLSSVSHELRSPLSTIKASISSLRTGTVEWDTEARNDLLAAIEEETDHLNQLVGNLLDMSKIETGALNPKRRWNSISEILGSVLKRMNKDLQEHHLLVDIPSNIPPVPVDYVQIEQVFTNLISNSIKYAPTGTEIDISMRLQPDQTVLVQLSNQGPHVPEEHLKQIFDKFYRVTAADKVTGTGLGLSICKGIIEAHGGRIWAQNAPGHFVFFFILPTSWEGISPQTPKEMGNATEYSGH